MPAIYLIRHGQASFHSSNYDQLSELGQRQASYAGAQLGRELGPIGQRRKPVSWFCGTLSRQIDTEQRVRAACMGERPSQQEEPVVNAGFNEFDHEALLAHYLMELKHVPDVEAFLNAIDQRARLFQPAFKAVVNAWIRDDDRSDIAADPERAEPVFESWNAFKARIVDAFENAIGSSWKANTDVCIVSSGGPISLMMQAILKLDDVSALDANWVLANTSITKLIYRNNREAPPKFNDLRLAYFNHYQYLQNSPEGDAVSFR